MWPESRVTRAPIPSPARNDSQRPLLLAPTTIWVAFSARAKSSSATATSSPTTWCQVPPIDSVRRRWRPTSPGSTRARPSLRTTCTARRSEPVVRAVIRTARRSSVSPSGPPGSATTMRSRASHGWSIPWAAR